MIETLIIVNSIERRDALRKEVKKGVLVVRMGDLLGGRRFHRVYLLDPLIGATEKEQKDLDYWWDFIKTVRLYPRDYVFVKDLSTKPKETESGTEEETDSLVIS